MCVCVWTVHAVEWWKEWNQAHSLTKELKEELKRELKETLTDFFIELSMGKINQTTQPQQQQQNVTKEEEEEMKGEEEVEEEEKKKEHEEEKELLEMEEVEKERVETTKKPFVMFEGFDTRPPDQLADQWRQLISDAVQKLPLPANITQELAFNPAQADHNNYLRCLRVQHISGQLYVYLDKYSTFQLWYPYYTSPTKHVIQCSHVSLLCIQ